MPTSTYVSVAAGSNTQIQFNDNGAFAGAAGLLWDSGTDILTFAAQSGNPNIQILDQASSNTAGYQFALVGSKGNGSGAGGDTDWYAGDGGATGNGGPVNIYGGSGGATSGIGGNIVLTLG